MLTLSIDMDSFEDIRQGKKKEEYREIKPYYTSRLVKVFPFTSILKIPKQDGVPREVEFKVGVSKKAPKILTQCLLNIGCGCEEYGGVPGEWCYVLRIQKVCEDGGGAVQDGGYKSI